MQVVRGKLNIGTTYSRIFRAIRCEYATVFKSSKNVLKLLI